jgi:transcription initiation factor IIA, gamma subunit, helical domain
VFRFSNLGTALIQSLDNMVQEGQITGAQRESVLKQFDKVRFGWGIDI